jgi:hypothetical protein
MVTGSCDIDWVAAAHTFQRAQAQPPLQKYRERRWGQRDKFAEWILESVLPSLSMEQALALYAASGGARRKEFVGNHIGEVRESLDFLLYDAVSLEGRFQECAAQDGAYKLLGAGKEFVSYLLCVKDPMTFATWNSTMERAMRKMKIPTKTLNKAPLGVAYVDLLNGAFLLRRQLGLRDFRSLDVFSYSITRAAAKGGV